MPKLQIPSKFEPFITKKKRFKIAIGGRGSAKSMSIADLCLMDCQTKGTKTACFREFQNSIDDSVHSLLSSEINRLSIPGFDIQANKILFDGKEVFKFRGLARNHTAIQSMHGFSRFWVEEAQTISYKSLRALTPTLRESGSEIWMSANPQSSADPFSQRFIMPFEKELISNRYYEDDMHIIVVANWSDNPFFPDVLNQERIYDKSHLTTAEYLHVWEGNFNDEVSGSIISVDWFNAAIDAHLKLGFEPKGAKIAAFDPSDQGGDAKGFAIRHGSVITDVDETMKGDVNQGCDWAIQKARDCDHFVWDCDGLGASLNRQVEQSFCGRKVDVHQFKGSKSPDDYYNGKPSDNTFRNMRAKNYWLLRDRFYNTYRAVNRGEYVNPDEMISISSDIKLINQLRAEVCRMPRKSNPNGLIQIKSKDEMLKDGIASPNMADSLMMLMMTPNMIDLDYSLNMQSVF